LKSESIVLVLVKATRAVFSLRSLQTVLDETQYDYDGD
jgi:hypothetical protein